MGFLSIFIGVLIVYGSLLLMRREIRRGMQVVRKHYPGISDKNTHVIMDEFDRMETLVNELNASYYEVSSDLEGKYSVHDKEISLLEGRLNALEKSFGRHEEHTVVDQQSNVRMGDRKIGARSGVTQEVTDASMIGTPLISSKQDLMTMSDQEKNHLRKRVIDLRQKGLTLSQIARELGVGVGELQLFLNLNRNQ